MKLRLDQWFRWPGVLPRSFQYAPRAMFSPRHSGSRGTRDQQPLRRAARHLGDRVLGVRDVLEHLDRRGDLELVVGERQVLGLHDHVLQARVLAALPGLVQLRVVEVEPDDALHARRLGPLVGEHALAAAHVEQRAWAPPWRTAPPACPRSAPSAA